MFVSNAMVYTSLAWLMLLASFAKATSVSTFDITTSEAFQVSILTGSGVRPTIGWTNLEDGSTSITVAVQKTGLGWLGFGVSSNDGLGSSLMYGGQGGGAVIYRSGTVTTDPIKEYSLLGPASSQVVPYDTSPISLPDVTKCVTDLCLTQAQACLGQPLCSDAFKCGQTKFGSLSLDVNTTLALAYAGECAGPLTDPRNPDQVSALAALLEAGGCVVSSCTKRVLDRGIRTASLANASFVQDGTSSILRFHLKTREIAGIPLSRNPSTPAVFMVAFGDVQPGGFVAHSTGERGFTTVNIDAGTVQSVDPPGWIASHVALCVIGFGIFYPLAVIARALPMHKYSWLAFVFLALAISISAIGAVVVSSYNGRSDFHETHSILGVISLLLVVAYLLLNMLQPIDQPSNDAKAWEKITLVGVKQTQLDIDNKKDYHIAMGILFRTAELGATGIVIATFLTGSMSLTDSAIQQNTAYMTVSIISVAVCGVGVAIAWSLRLCKRKKPATERRNTVNNANSPGTLQSSPNPAYGGSNVEMETGLSDDSSEIEAVPLFLTWEKVSFYAKPKRGEIEGKRILNNAIGSCAPRTLTAVLGPSGAGKSTLMEILALRSRKAPSPESRLCINGAPAGSFPGIHRLMGYVPQSDVLHEYLTVLETLQFTCKMILPEEMSEQAKVNRMLRVVTQLGIGHILDTRVGGDSIRGISGGERRRISIALQMLKSPSILFLDEPTSGLDAHLALRLVRVLRELANEGRTIFATIHQPSAACFELFDRVVLLSGGYTVFSGMRTTALQFMKEVGREVPYQWNPADWLLTVIDYTHDEDRLVQNEAGHTVYKTDKVAEEVLRRRGVLANGNQMEKFRNATSMSAIGLDVSELRDNVREYYRQVNPAKLAESPGVVEEIVSFTIAKGVDALDKRLLSRYKVSILPFFKAKEARNVEPCTWDELVGLIKSFASSKYGFELVDNIHKAKDNARHSLARMGPEVNARFILRHMESTGDVTSAESSLDKRDGVEENMLTDYPQSFMNQVRLLSRRQVTLVWRNPQALRFQALQNIIFGVLLGALYSNVRFLKSSPFQQSIVMAIILAMVAFVTLSLGTQVAFNDRLVLEREMSDAMFSPIAHFVSRLIIGIPVAFFIALCLILPAYFWVGLQPEGDAFFFFCLVNAAVVFLFDSVVFALTLFVNDINSAYAIGNFYEAMAIFFSGVFLPIYAMPVFFRWIYFLSPFSYAFGAVVVNEFQGTENEFTVAVTGVVIRSAWPNLLILFGMGVLWRAFGLVGIIRLFRRKRPGSVSWHLNRQQKGNDRALDISVITKSPMSPIKGSDISIVTKSPKSPEKQGAVPKKVAV